MEIKKYTFEITIPEMRFLRNILFVQLTYFGGMGIVWCRERKVYPSALKLVRGLMDRLLNDCNIGSL